LKNKIRLVDLWLWDGASNALVAGDVADSAVKSFTLGWPTVNYRAVFATADERRTWFEKLQQ
jgi:hypothetical protein